MSHPTTPGYFPHRGLELRCAETTTSASQLEASLEAAPIEQFPENHDIVEQPILLLLLLLLLLLFGAGNVHLNNFYNIL
jgi:hypothetical protein